MKDLLLGEGLVAPSFRDLLREEQFDSCIDLQKLRRQLCCNIRIEHICTFTLTFFLMTHAYLILPDKLSCIVLMIALGACACTYDHICRNIGYKPQKPYLSVSKHSVNAFEIYGH